MGSLTHIVNMHVYNCDVKEPALKVNDIHVTKCTYIRYILDILDIVYCL